MSFRSSGFGRPSAGSTATGLASATALAGAAAFLQAPAARELSLVFGGTWLATGTFAAAPLLLGAGAALPRGPGAGGWAAIGGGLAVAALGLLLGLAPSHLPLWHAASALAALGACALALGAGFAAGFLRALRSGTSAGIASAATSGGALAGLSLGLYAASSLGANACLLACGLGLAAAPLLRRIPPRWACAAVLAAAASLFAGAPALDEALEALRPVRIVMNVSNSNLPEDIAAAGFRRVWGGWSPYARLDIYKEPGSGWLVGALDHRALWTWNSRPGEPPSPGFAFLRPTDRVALIGSAAGFESRLFPPDFPLERLTLVEIDPMVVGYFRRHPEQNLGTYHRVETFVGDGRAFLERRREPLDTLIVGSLDSTSRSPWRAAHLSHTLYTREGFLRALSALKPDGLLVYAPRDPRMAACIARAAEAERLRPRILYRRVRPTRSARETRIENSETLLLFSRDERRLEEAVRRVDERQAARGRRTVTRLPVEVTLAAWNSTVLGPLTDARPFLLGLLPEAAPVLGASWAAALCLAAAALAAAVRSGRGAPRAYYFAVGSGLTLLQLGLAATWRSALGSPLTTAAVVSAALLLGHSAGGAASARLAGFVTPVRLSCAIAAAAAWAALGALYFPHGAPFFPSLLAASASALPAGFLSGIFFPLGLARGGPGALRYALFWDGAGAAAGYALFLLTAYARGLPAALGLALISYLAAAATLPRLAGHADA